MKTAVVFGATSGIGYEIAKLLAEQKWEVTVTGRRIELMERMQKRFGNNIIPYQMDVTKPEATEIVDRILTGTSTPDLFLYVAGIGFQNKELDEQKEIDTVRTNAEGMVRIISHLFNHIKSNNNYTFENKAHIAVVTSVAGIDGLGLTPAYSASKKMQITYLTALSQLSEMEKIPVKITDIRPGFVDTGMLNKEKKYPMLMDKEKVAKLIVKGLEKKPRVLIVDWRYKLLVGFWKLIPRCIWEKMTWIKN